jgi:hypothetical protein
LRTAETTELTPILRAEIGNELLAMRLVGAQEGTQVVSRPFGSLVIHAGDTMIEYRVATSRMAQEASALADDETLLPTVSQRAGDATLEHGLHQEIRFGHHSEHGATVQVAAFHDRMVNPLVQGSGSISDADALSGDLLIDPVSGVFRTSGNTYAGYGFSVAATVPLAPAIAISAAMEAGSALEDSYFHSDQSSQERSIEQSLAAMRPRLTPAVTVAAQGNLQKTGTYWRTSYRWQAPDTVTAVNPYASAASNAYLSILLRQPIRVGRIFPGGTRAVVDMRNLLAQGYCPFVTPDGSTMFFAQADRSIAGGIAFTF